MKNLARLWNTDILSRSVVIVLLSITSVSAFAAPVMAQATSVAFAANAWPQDTGAAVNSSPVLGDLDGDGILEIVVGSDNRKVYAWKPDGTLMPGWPVSTEDAVRSSPALADVDGDGKLDVIVGSYDNKVYIWNFNGSLLAGWPAVTGSVVYSSPAVGDIDGDQRPEIVVGSFDNNVYAWNADGTLVRGWPKPTGLFVYSSPALADIDQDGQVEVIIGTDNNRVFAWNGDGSDVSGWPVATEHVVPSSPAIADLDNDGKLDVIAASWDKVLAWNHHGERKPGWPVTTSHQIPSSPAIADLDLDGNLDVIIGCKDGRVYAWSAKGQILPGWPTVTDDEILSSSPAIADLDGDGRLDVVIGSKDQKVYAWDYEGRLLPTWPKRTGGEVASSPAIGDLDGDGTLEVVIGSKDGKVYAWNFPRTGTVAPRVVWGGFRSDAAHSGIYNAQPGARIQPIVIVDKGQPTGATAPGLASQQARTLPAEQQPGVLPQIIQDGLISDLAISDYTTTDVVLTWTAPAGLRTTQTVYDIRYASEPVTDATWSQATPYPEAVRPLAPGTREVYPLRNVPTAETFYVAIKVREGQQEMPLSNVAHLQRLDTTPPAMIQEVMVTELDEQTLELSWKTTGDNGLDGTAASYDVRYADAPLTELTWLRAIQVENEPPPLPAGAEQKMRVQKPWNDREIFLGIKAIDGALNISALSTVAAWSPKDATPPARIVDLRVTHISGAQITVSWTAPGSSFNVGKASQYDLRYSDELLTEANWMAARTFENLPLPEAAGTPQTYTLDGIPIGTLGYVGIKAIDSDGNSAIISNVVETAMDDQAPPAAVTDLKVEQVDRNWVRISWTATGDDGKKGMAAAYVLRYGGEARVVQDWTPARDVQDVPMPSVAGSQETALISGLTENTTYYIGLQAVDKQGNASALSNMLTVKTFGLSTPAAVTDLAIEELKAGLLTLNWAAPQDFGENAARVKSYELRYARAEISEATWEQAKKVSVGVPPAEPGTLETYTIKDLPLETTYYVALKSVDSLGNVSGLSNILAIPALDKVAPAPIFDLAIEESGTDWVRMTWTATGDDKKQGQAANYQIRVAPNLQVLKDWSKATEIPEIALSPASAGEKESFTIQELKSKTTFYVGVKAGDEFGNMSELSNIVRISTKDPVPPATVYDLQVTDIREEAIVLNWTAPGDDEMTGRAASYDIRYATEPLSEENWATAQMVPVVPRPSPAGEEQTLTLTGLAPNTLYYIGIITTDTSGNTSELSNIADVLTIDTVPPEAITTLRAMRVEENAVWLTWVSPGDDEFRDMPERYEIRYRKGKEPSLDEASWNESAQVREPPIPSGKGNPEEFDLTGLDSDAFYSIGVKAFDRDGNAASISNIVQIYTVSDVVADLSIFEFSGQSVTLTWTTPGGSFSEERRYDIRYATTPITEENWESAISAKTALPQDALVKEPKRKEKIELVGLPPYEQVFLAVRLERPVIEAEEEEETSLSALSNVVELNRIDIIPPGTATHVEAKDLGEKEGKQKVEISWFAPGDNEYEGKASRYDIRYGTEKPTPENWETLTVATDAPEPQDSGSPQKMAVEITPGEDTVYFAMKTMDEALNESGISNTAEWSPSDAILPAAVVDLRVENVTGGDITLSWTAPGDNDNRGTAAFYDIRYAAKESDLKKWDLANVVAGEPLPAIAGTRQEYTIAGLQQDTTYYIALTTTDDAKNTSALSNLALVKSSDAVAPAPIQDLKIVKTGTDSVELAWTASGDDGNSGRATAYSLRYAMTPDGLTAWDQAIAVADVPAPKNPGSQERFTVTGLRSNVTHYFGIKAVDNGGNTGEVSNLAQTLTADGESSPSLSDLAFVGGTDTSATISWTAPQDSGPVARLAKYDIRYAEEQASVTQWNSALRVKQTLVPKEPGTVESFEIPGLLPNKRYYVALKAIDHVGNTSEISNIATAYTTDTVPPQPVTDLGVQAVGKDAITLVWTVIADDSIHDMPEGYELRYAFEPITEANWGNATAVVPEDATAFKPTLTGAPVQYTVTGLAENANYHFALRARDTNGNVSPLSNVAVARTSDVTPPQAVADLQAIFPMTTSIVLTWTSPADIQTGPAVANETQTVIPPVDLTVQAYDIRYTTVAPSSGQIDDQIWETAERVLVPPQPTAAGEREEFVVRNLEPGTAYYFAIKAIDYGSNLSALSNTVVEVTLPSVLDTKSVADASAQAREYAWEIQQGQELAAINKDAAGIMTLAPTATSRSLTAGTALTAVYPQASRSMLVRQGALHFQVKSSERFTIYARVSTETGEEMYLGYTTDFGILPSEPEADDASIQASADRRLTPTVTRRMKRIEKYLFFSLDQAMLDNQWHDVSLNFAQDLMDGAGVAYAATSRIVIRGNTLAFQNMMMQGPVFSKVDDFQDLRSPLEKGWKIHYGSGSVEVQKEVVTPSLAERAASSTISTIGVTPKAAQENLFLTAKADSHLDLVLTYPKEGMGAISDKSIFMASVRYVGNFKMILKVTTKDKREYYLAYIPPDQIQQTGLSGNYLYLPVQIQTAQGTLGNWSVIQAKLNEDMQRYNLEYAYTTWISFHGKDFAIDDVRFSADEPETAIR